MRLNRTRCFNFMLLWVFPWPWCCFIANHAISNNMFKVFCAQNNCKTCSFVWACLICEHGKKWNLWFTLETQRTHPSLPGLILSYQPADFMLATYLTGPLPLVASTSLPTWLGSIALLPFLFHSVQSWVILSISGHSQVQRQALLWQFKKERVMFWNTLECAMSLCVRKFKSLVLFVQLWLTAVKTGHAHTPIHPPTPHFFTHTYKHTHARTQSTHK